MARRIVCGLSGGVDSSVAALLLQQEGWDVVGVYMKSWTNTSDISECSYEDDMREVRRVCTKLNISYYTFDFEKEYRMHVFDEFLDGLKHGETPNPDIACNEYIKFRVFADRALQLPNVSAIATGHYAAIRDGFLMRPRDRAKDQTYFLARMPQRSISHIRFPLASYTKSEVRALARSAGLPNANRKDSMGICFIGPQNYQQFIRQYIPVQRGSIVDTHGTVLGEHDGVAYFTIGQRHGFGIGGRGPYYVVEKDVTTNTLVVTNNPQDHRLMQKIFHIRNIQWFYPAPSQQISLNIQVRYRQKAIPATLRVSSHHAQEWEVQTIFPLRAVTPGQVAVMYDGDIVRGSGIITS